VWLNSARTTAESQGVEHGPAAHEAGPARRDTSNLTLALTIGYVRSHLGEDGVADLLRAAREERPLSELCNEARWSTQAQKMALFEAAAEVMHDPEVARRIGETVLQQQTGTAVRIMLRTVGSPAALCRSVAKAGAKFSTNYTCEAISVGRNEAVISNRLHDGYQPHQMDCDYTAGLMSQIPGIFGLPLATVTHDECQVRGAPACIYQLRWRARHRLPWRGRRAHTAHLTEQLRLLSERHEALQSTVVDLISPADVDTVLARITRRAADAVRAQAFVLALMHEDGEPSVHHDGISHDDALRLAREVLAPDPDDHGGSRLIVEVASARNAYGRLAAIYAPGHTFFPEERRLLTTYARQAAVALDAATALEEARQRGETAQTLLDLARALAQTVTTDEVAQRLAEAVPTVTGAEQASVMLWEPDRERMTIRARSRPDDGPRATPAAVTPGDTPALAAFLSSLEPQHIRLQDITDPYVIEWMEVAGVEEALIVPILNGGNLVGAISAHRSPGSPPLIDRRVLSARLAGLADQASLAFAKVRLLEQERDAVRRLELEEGRIKHLAYHDALTGLPNGRMFGEALDAGLVSAAATNTSLAVLFCDLDRFKTVNDSLGHAQGDQLLRLSAARLSACTRQGDVLARLSGDEFTVMLRHLDNDDEGVAVGERILEALRKPFIVDGQELFLSVSVGAAFFPEDGADADTLMKNADAAMYRAKAAGRDGQVRYMPAMNARARHLLALEADLHNALARGELEVHYQPELDAQRRVVAIEALARWPHPDLGWIPPSEFIPLAEQSGLILALDEWVLNEACREAKTWQTLGCPPIRVAVNLSAHQFSRASLPTVVRAALAAADLSPELLELELTETAAMGQPDGVARILHKLTRLGVHLAVDDYGTGYSICGHVKDFPIGRLKIDQSFVAGLPHDLYDCAIVSSTISLAHSIGMEITAEGVETQAQADYLFARGCDLVQGFLYARPMPADQLRALLEAQLALS
jgi:diguanylate cyclase (GGDEF)-like protein